MQPDRNPLLDNVFLSPTQLTAFAACRHAARLNLDRRLGRPTPTPVRYPDADLLAEMGTRHEEAYLRHLQDRGHTVERIGVEAPDADTRLRELMVRGVDVIAQAPMRKGAWRGVARFVALFS